MMRSEEGLVKNRERIELDYGAGKKEPYESGEEWMKMRVLDIYPHKMK